MVVGKLDGLQSAVLAQTFCEVDDRQLLETTAAHLECHARFVNCKEGLEQLQSRAILQFITRNVKGQQCCARPQGVHKLTEPFRLNLVIADVQIFEHTSVLAIVIAKLVQAVAQVDAAFYTKFCV